jgi:ADP-glucose pyrophosphorylase
MKKVVVGRRKEIALTDEMVIQLEKLVETSHTNLEAFESFANSHKLDARKVRNYWYREGKARAVELLKVEDSTAKEEGRINLTEIESFIGFVEGLVTQNNNLMSQLKFYKQKAEVMGEKLSEARKENDELIKLLQGIVKVQERLRYQTDGKGGVRVG